MADNMDAQINAITARLSGGVAKIKAEYCLEIVRNLRDACPVKTGHAKANIVPSVGAPFRGIAYTDVRYQAGVISVQRSSVEDELFITNNVPYWPRLIAGWSPQAPAGFDLIAIDKAEQTMRERYGAIEIDVTTSSSMSELGGFAAGNVASAYSPRGE